MAGLFSGKENGKVSGHVAAEMLKKTEDVFFGNLDGLRDEIPQIPFRKKVFEIIPDVHSDRLLFLGGNPGRQGNRGGILAVRILLSEPEGSLDFVESPDLSGIGIDEKLLSQFSSPGE